jgi:adenylate cyclase
VVLGALLALAAGLLFRGSPDAGWLDQALRTPQPRPAAVAEPADGRPVVAVLPIEAVGSPSNFSPDLLRSMVLDGIARFDEVAVIDQPAGEGRGALERYALNLRFNTAVPAPNVSARLTHEPSGKIVWARSFDLANRADPTVAAETDIARQIATSVGQPYGVLFADLRQRPSLDTRTRCIVQAYDYWNNPSAESHARVRDCVEGVVTAQPSAATALANLSYFHLDEHRIRHNVRPNPLDRALTAARRAVEIAAESPRTN